MKRNQFRFGRSNNRTVNSCFGNSVAGRRTEIMANLSKTTRDHDEIRRWAEERGAEPACVKGTGNEGDIGLLRLDFPGYSGEESLQHITWDEFFDKFDERNLALLYQEETAGGERSNFNKIVSAETAEENERGIHRKAGARGSRSSGSSRRSAGAAKSAGSRTAAKKTASSESGARSAAKKGGVKKSVAAAKKGGPAKKSAIVKRSSLGRGGASASKKSSARSVAKKAPAKKSASKKSASKKSAAKSRR
jgi:hypothetical protein